MIDAILFDKDGTLFDFRASWAGWADRFITELAPDDATAGRLADALGYLREARDFRPDSVVIAGTAEDAAVLLRSILPGIDDRTLTAINTRIAAMTAMQPAVPLRPVLQALRARGLRLGLATNDAEQPARTHLEAHGIADLFDFVAGFDSGHGAKPQPGMMHAFLRVTGIAPSCAVMVGDSHHDLVAGRAAGMRTVAVLTGIASYADLAPLADAVLPDIGTLGDWIDMQSDA